MFLSALRSWTRYFGRSNNRKSLKPRQLSKRWRGLTLQNLEARETPATLVGLDALGKTLVTFDSTTPGTAVSTGVSGLISGTEKFIGIDVRPANANLYGVTDEGRLYTINRTTGAASLVGTLGADPTDVTNPFTTLSGSSFGLDFNPVADRLRLVSDSGQNLRINVDTALVITDADLNPGTPAVTGAAYTNNFAGAPSTTLYAIDFNADQLFTINPPNNGTLNPVGSGLGVNTDAGVGFDIDNLGNAFATLTSGGKTFLYSVNLTTGLASPLGQTSQVLTGLAAIDSTAPTVLTFNPLTVSPTNSSTIEFVVTFTEPVTGVDATDFAIKAGPGLTGGMVSGVAGSGSSYTITLNGFAGDDTVSLDLVDDDSITDLSGNALGGTGAGNGDASASSAVDVDLIVPTVVTFAPLTTSPTNSGTVEFIVVFNEAVTGVDTADFAIDAGAGVSGGIIAGVAGSGTSYTITLNGFTGNGTIGLNLNDDDSIADDVGNKLGGTGAGNGNSSAAPVVTLDQTAPSVATFTPLTTSPTNSGSVDFVVTFSEAVTGVNAADFAVKMGAGLSGGKVSNVAGAGNSYTITVNGLVGDDTVSLDLVDNNSIIDDAGNQLGGPVVGDGDASSATAVTIDQTAPTATTSVKLNPATSPTNATTLTFRVTFSEPVQNVTAADFAAFVGGTITNGLISVAGSGTDWDVTVNTVAGDGSVRLDVVAGMTLTDAAGNKISAPFTGGESYLVDQTAPDSTITVAGGQANPTSSQPVNFTITFSEKVTGFDATDIKISGTAGATTAKVTTTDSITFNVEVSGATQAGSIIINFDPLAATDDAGNGSDAPDATANTITLLNNQAPTITAPATTSGDEDGKISFGGATAITIADADAGTAEVKVTITITNGVFTLSSKTGLTFTDGDGQGDSLMSFTGKLADINAALNGAFFVGNADFVGSASVKIDVDDQGNTGFGGAQTATSTVDVTVNGVNDVPTVTFAGTATTPEDTALTFSAPLTITIADVDLNGNPIRVTVTVTNGTFNLSTLNGLTINSGADGTSSITVTGSLADVNAALNGLKFTPSKDFNGNAVLSVAADDLGSTGAPNSTNTTVGTGSTTITVTAVNDGPSVTAPATATVNEDATLTFSGSSSISISDVDAGSGKLKVSLTATNGTVTLSTTSGLSFTVGDGTNDSSLVFEGTLTDINAALLNMKYTPTANFSGAASVTLDVDDQGNTGTGGALTDSKSVAVTVTSVNDAPTAVNDSFTVQENGTLRVNAPGILGNDSDPEGTVLNVVQVSDVPASSGRLVLNGDGSFDFTPRPGFVGTVTFQYKANDGLLQSNVATVTITVNPIPRTRLTATGADAGGGSQVNVYNPDGSLRYSFLAYDEAFAGGVHVATGDVNGDGFDDIITGAGSGGSSHVRVISGKDFGQIHSFMAFDPTVPCGAFVTAGDVNGDGRADIIVGAGKNGGPHVRVFDAVTGQVIQDFFAYEKDFAGGVSVAAGDFDGDFLSDIVTGAGPGGSPHVAVYKGGAGSTLLSSFLAFDPLFSGGVNVAVGRFNGQDVIFTAAGAGGVPVVQVFGTQSENPLAAFFAFDQAVTSGVRIATERQDDGTSLLLLSSNGGSEPLVRVLNADTLGEVRAFNAFDPSFLGGVFVG